MCRCIDGRPLGLLRHARARRLLDVAISSATALVMLVGVACVYFRRTERYFADVV